MSSRLTCEDSGSDLALLVQKVSASVVSVDLFDTLVFRRCSNPKSVFRIQYRGIARLLPDGMSEDAWLRLRKECEHRLSRAAAPHEITLCDIYEEIGRVSGLERDVTETILHAELDAEKSVIRPYTDIIGTLEQLSADHRICITTDTYLPENFIRGVLENYLKFPFDLRCSSVTGLPKRSGLAFGALQKAYPGEKILHVGDNPVSDIKRANGSGVSCALIRHCRAARLKDMGQTKKYLNALGIYRYPTPYDESYVFAADRRRRELAWKWAAVLADFLFAADAYAKKIRPDEIWMLSRDCEVLHEVTINQDRLFFGIPVKYIYTSRMASHPVFAKKDPAFFSKIYNRAPDKNELDAADTLCAAYNAQRAPDSRRILVIDNGWKGRIQYALQLAMPECEIFGFYFSLDRPDGVNVADRYACFEPWSSVNLRKSAIEVLSGFTGDSCIGYCREPGRGFVPVFRTSDGDKAPAAYKADLVRYLKAFVEEMDPACVAGTECIRRAYLRDMLIFPNRKQACALRGWSMSTKYDGAGISAVCDRSTVFGKKFGRSRIWPNAAIWSFPASFIFARLYQGQSWMRYVLSAELRTLRSGRGRRG